LYGDTVKGGGSGRGRRGEQASKLAGWQQEETNRRASEQASKLAGWQQEEANKLAR